MFRFLFKKKKQRVHFLHIGKTGGSAAKSVLKNFPETDKYSIKLHGHGTSIKDIRKGDSIVFFLRDPISRFISGFYSRQRKGQPRYYAEWRPQEKVTFENFSTPNEVATALANEEELGILAMNSVKHFRHYDNWYVNFDYFKSRIDDILFIGFQESLDSDFPKLIDLLDIPEEVSLPTCDVTAHQNPENLDKNIDPDGIAALEKWYAEDIKFFELCKEIMANKATASVQDQ